MFWKKSAWVQSVFGLFLLGVTLGAGSPQCARTADLPLSPASEGTQISSEITECVQECQRTRRTEIMAETDIFVATVTGCDGDKSCIAAARGAFVTNMAAITARAEACLASCHDQGSATGGQ